MAPRTDLTLTLEQKNSVQRTKKTEKNEVNKFASEIFAPCLR